MAELTPKQRKLTAGTVASVRPRRKGAPRIRIVIIDATENWESRFRWERNPSGRVRRSWTEIVPSGSGKTPGVKVNMLVDRRNGERWEERVVKLTSIGLEPGTDSEQERNAHDTDLRRRNGEKGKERLNLVALALEYLCGGKVTTVASRGVRDVGGKLSIDLKQAEALLALLPREDVAHAIMVGRRKGANK